MEPRLDEGGAERSSRLVTVQAHAFASTFRLRELAAAFEGGDVGVHHDELAARFPDGTVALAFDFGALVLFDGSEARREALVAHVARLTGDTGRRHTEEFLVEVAPGAPHEVRFDRVVVPELTAAVRQVVGLLLAQSAAMDYYEEDVTSILTRTERITRELGERGRIRGSVGALTRFIGNCILTKNEVVETLALFDKPESTWRDEAIDRLFTRLREMLEIDDRFRALEYRLRTIQDSLVLLVDLSRGRSTIRLEQMVVVLILLEIVIMVWQVMSGRGH